MLCIAIKGHVLANLVAKLTEYPGADVAEEGESVGVQVARVAVLSQPIWKLYVNRAANQRGFRVEIVLVSLKRITIEKSLRLGFSTTNIKAEHEALLIGVAMVKKLRGKAIEIFSESRLIIKQVNGELGVGDHRMQRYLNKAQQL